jgi:hypothetical protein
VRSARKSFGNAKSKPNSQVAALIEKESGQKLYSALVPSFGTLLVVPSVLVEHWKVCESLVPFLIVAIVHELFPHICSVLMDVPRLKFARILIYAIVPTGNL